MNRVKAISITMISLLVLSAIPLTFAKFADENIAGSKVTEFMSSPSTFSLEKAAEYMATHQNFDGGFGKKEIGYTHMGVESLESLGKLDKIDGSKTIHWIAAQNLPAGTWFTFEALRTLEILGGFSSVNTTSIAEQVASWQQENGSWWNNVGDTFYAVMTLKMINFIPTYKQAAIDWIRAFQSSEGGFNPSWTNMEETYYGIKALEALDAINYINIELTIQWILQCKNENGGFGNRPGWGSDIRQTYYATQCLKRLNAIDRFNTTSTIEWLLNLQRTDGGFSLYSAISNFEDTYFAVETIILLGGSDKIDQGVSEFLLQHYDPIDGAFRWESETYVAYYAVDALATADALNRVNTKSAIRNFKRSQNYDGGFGGRKDWGSNLIDTCEAIITLNTLEALGEINTEDALQYIVECQNRDGGFGNSPSENSWLRPTFYALLALKLLNGMDKINKAAVIGWISSCQIDGGFTERPGFTWSNLEYTYYAVHALWSIDSIDVINIGATINYLTSNKRSDGTYGNVQETYAAVYSLTLLRRLDLLDYATKTYVASLQNFDGGFGWWPNEPSNLDATYYAMIVLHLLISKVISVPSDYPSIQSAINAAFPEDTVYVKPGIYNEEIIVNKTLALVGEDVKTTIINGSNREKPVQVLANNVNMTRFTIIGDKTDLYTTGISLYNVSNCYISENVITNHYTAIYLSGSSNNVITGNSINNNNEGVYLYSSSSNTLSYNDITGNGNQGVHSYYSNYTSIIYNDISDNNYEGLYSYYSSNVSLIGNRITGNRYYGLSYYSSFNVSISLNIIADNNYGLRLSGVHNSIFSDNNITNNYYGFELSYSSDDVLRNNILDGNRYGFYVYGDTISHFFHDIDTSNIVNGKIIYWIANQSGLTIDPSTYPNAGFLALVNCTKMTVEQLTLSTNEQGMVLAFTNDSSVTNNHIWDNYYGVYMTSSFGNIVSLNNFEHNRYGVYLRSNSSNNMVDANRIADSTYGVYVTSSLNNTVQNTKMTGNTYAVYLISVNDTTVFSNVMENNIVGIYLSQSSNITIELNNITNSRDIGVNFYNSRNNTFAYNYVFYNFYGIVLENSYYNTLHHNNFTYNYRQLWTRNATGNTWDDGFKGNYWSDYNGTDTNDDGIGDTDIPWWNVDSKPIMDPPSPDLNKDGIVNIIDVEIVAKAFGAYPNNPRWDLKCDMNHDGEVNLWDITFIVMHFNK